MTTNHRKTVPLRPNDIIGSKEAAEILGVERTRIARYRRTGQIPEPWSESVSASPIWLRRDIEKIARKRAKQHAERAEQTAS
jgi:predicted site-specific integrase-resolvase